MSCSRSLTLSVHITGMRINCRDGLSAQSREGGLSRRSSFVMIGQSHFPNEYHFSSHATSTALFLTEVTPHCPLRSQNTISSAFFLRCSILFILPGECVKRRARPQQPPNSVWETRISVYTRVATLVIEAVVFPRETGSIRMDDGEKDEQAPLEPSTADWLSVDQFFSKSNSNHSRWQSTNLRKEFEPLDVQTTEQNVTSDGHQNDTDFDFDFVSGTAYQTGFEGVYSDSNAQMALGSRFESLPSNPDSRGVNLNDRTVPYLEDWLANSELERLQASTQATTNRILRDFTSSEPVASESYDPACGYPAASGDVVETPNHFQFDNLQFDAPQGPPQEHTNPSGLPMPSEASNGYFQLPVIYNPLETGWETTDFVQTGFPILRGAESMSFIPRSLSEWDSIACGTSQQNPSKTGRLDQKSEVDNAQSGVDPNVMGIDSGARGASWGFELRDGGKLLWLHYSLNELLANSKFVDDSRDNASNSGPQFGSSLAQSVGKDFYTSNLPREAYLLRLRKPLLDIEKDEFVLNPDGTPRVSPITITNYKKVDFLPDVIDYRRLNGAVLIRAELKGASLKIHIIPRIDPNTLRPRQLKNLKKEIQSRKEKQSVDGKPDNEKNIDQELQGYEKVQMEDDDDLEANDEYDKSDGELRSEIATDSKVSRKGRVRYNLNTVAERLSRCLSNMKQKYRKEHGLGFACGTNVLKQPKGSSTKEPTKEASRILEGGSIRIEKLLFVS